MGVSDITWFHVLLGLQVILLFLIWRAVVAMEGTVRDADIVAAMNRIAIATETLTRRPPPE